MLQNFYSITNLEIAPKAKLVDSFCGICLKKGKCYKNVVSSNFVGFDKVKNDVFCKKCSKLFDPIFRQKHLHITEKKINIIKQCDFLPILRNLKFPCCLSFSDTFKKHRGYYAELSHDRNNVKIILENNLIINIDLDIDLPFLEYLEKFYNKFKVSKEEIEKQNFHGKNLLKIQNEIWTFLEKTNPYIGTLKYLYFIKFINQNDNHNTDCGKVQPSLFGD
jgi:hypothetical protein